MTHSMGENRNRTVLCFSWSHRDWLCGMFFVLFVAKNYGFWA